jgi:hypothetical protein
MVKDKYMKRREIIIWIIVVVGVGFYLGYKLSQKKHSLDIASSIPNQKIHLEYQLESPQRTDSYGKCVVDQTTTTYTCKGNMNLYVLFESIAQHDPNLGWKDFPKLSGRTYYLDIDPKIEKRKYLINLTSPHQESTEFIFNALGKELGFKTIVTETTIRFYRAVRNDRPIQFSPAKVDSNSTVRVVNNTRYFNNMDLGMIFSLYKSEGFNIENETGITDRYDGSLRISSSIEEVKKELETKAGIDLIPFEKTVKLIKIY